VEPAAGTVSSSCHLVVAHVPPQTYPHSCCRCTEHCVCFATRCSLQGLPCTTCTGGCYRDMTHMGHLSGGKTVSCTGTTAISHTAGNVGKAQMGIVRVNGSAGLGARKIESVATRLCPHVLHRPPQTAGGTDNALVSMVLAVFAGVWSAGTDCIMGWGGRGDADRSGRIVRPTDHTKPCALTVPCLAPCGCSPVRGQEGAATPQCCCCFTVEPARQVGEQLK
jgi:hypothetical protein